MISSINSRKIGVRDGQVLGVTNVFRMVGIDLNDISKNRPWTPDGVGYLVDLYLKGWTADKIAEEMNRTPGDVIGKIYDLGEAGELDMSMWGLKNNVDKQLPDEMFRLFVVQEKQKEGE